MTNPTTVDVTEAAAKETPLRKKARKGTTAVFVIAGVLLLVDDQVRRFSRKKRVKVTVADAPESTES